MERWHPFLGRASNSSDRFAELIEINRRQQQERINQSIEHLLNSGSYRDAHKEIKYLSSNKDWTIEQIRELCRAAVNNSQVNDIIADDDIKKFYVGLLRNISDSDDAINEVKTVLETIVD